MGLRGGRSRSERAGRGEYALLGGRPGEYARRDLDVERIELRLLCLFTRFAEPLGDGERGWWRFEDGVVSRWWWWCRCEWETLSALASLFEAR